MSVLRYWLPAAILIVAIINAFVQVPFFYKEKGFVENSTWVFLVASFVIVLISCLRNFKTMTPFDRVVASVLLMGSFYFAGEELSWGQHFFGFSTPERVAQNNYQGEFNVHNTRGIGGHLLDKLPRGLIGIGILLGGVIFPFCAGKLPPWIRRYLLGKAAVFVSVMALTISVPSKISNHYRPKDLSRAEWKNMHKGRFDGGELKECYIALFILLFSINFTRLVAGERLPGGRAGDASLDESGNA